jgi:hypothetical protein
MSNLLHYRPNIQDNYIQFICGNLFGYLVFTFMLLWDGKIIFFIQFTPVSIIYSHSYVFMEKINSTSYIACAR